jgi:hypothetical protein
LWYFFPSTRNYFLLRQLPYSLRPSSATDPHETNLYVAANVNFLPPTTTSGKSVKPDPQEALYKDNNLVGPLPYHTTGHDCRLM